MFKHATIQIVTQLDDLAARCQARLSSEGLELDRTKPEFDLPRVAVGIRDFMHDEGFGIAAGDFVVHELNLESLELI